MRTLIALAAALATSGCGLTMTAEELTRDGQRVSSRANQPPQAAAACVARNATRRTQDVPVILEPEAGRATYEVVIRQTGQISVTRAVMHLSPTAQGSSVEAWLNPGIVGVNEAYIESLLAGC